MGTSIKLRDFFKHYQGEPHQAAAVDLLQSMMPESLLRSDAEWVEAYRATPKPKAPTGEPTWGSVVDCARAAGARYPEVVAAQLVLESGWFKHTSGKNNYAGLKGPGTSVKTQEVVNGKTITITAEFLDFQDWQQCAVYLVDRWHRDWKNHRGVNNAPNRDEAARGLVKQGYATDPEYAVKLIYLMNQQAPLPKAPAVQQNGAMIEKVPYFSQRDSTIAGQAMRMCFSSSCAMLAAYLRPSELRGANADDVYLRRLQKYGDTTSATAQLETLESYGIRGRFVQNCTWEDLQRQIDNGVPVPCGFLHHGPSTAPSGGGHWLTVIGYTDSAVIVHDPFGEMDVVRGTYLSSKGARQAYSRKNWGPRWLVEGPKSGWAILAER
ncbi:glucosaminidase domain-containing protein [Vulcanococcus sp.]|uniref:glucosaminidase domain-containing protein n=1 Tax=Vulcanococcus sp. TaxID=2856995 RepID=UPI003F696365